MLWVSLPDEHGTKGYDRDGTRWVRLMARLDLEGLFQPRSFYDSAGWEIKNLLLYPDAQLTCKILGIHVGLGN